MHTRDLLEREILACKEAKDGAGKAWNNLMKDGFNDERLREIYTLLETKLKCYENSLNILEREWTKESTEEYKTVNTVTKGEEVDTTCDENGPA